MNVYKLGNAEERHKANPRTFQIGSRFEREDLKVGQLVKLIFEYEPEGAERMWVRVSEILPGPRFAGILSNQPLNPELKMGDKVDFGPENVASIGDPPN